jgi:DNA-binding transcriptional ArsR family regulator
MAEVTLSLRLLGCPQPTHIHAPWLRQARQRLDGVDLPLLLAVTPPGKWVLSCLMPPSPGPQVTIEEQLRGLTETHPDSIRRDLEEVWGEEPTLPRRVQELVDAGAAGLGRLAETLWDYWDAVIEPYWTKICAVLEDDVSFRVAAQVNGGLYALLEDLHPEVSLEGNLLHVDATATYEAHTMTLTPSVFAWPGLILDDGEGDRFGLTYAARGVGRVWEGLSSMDRTDEEDPLAALLGRTRAAILEMTAVPMSTTQIAHQMGQSPGSVNQHLSVLRDSGLVVSRRSGRSVLYRQTPLAQSMIAAQQVARHASSTVAPPRQLGR